METGQDSQGEEPPEAGPERALRAGEVRARWAGTAPPGWTERRVTALEAGGKGGNWSSLRAKVDTRPNLRAAFPRGKAHQGAAGVEHQTSAQVASAREAHRAPRAEELQAGTSRPRAVRRHWSPKPGTPREQRPLGRPPGRERVVQAALGNVLAPICERDCAAQR